MQDGFGTRGRESCAGWVLAVGLGGSCLTGCVELEELGNTLLDPEGEALSVPGSQIAQGLFSNIDLVHSVEHGPVLVALNDDGAEPRLSATKLGAIEKTATCFGAPTQWFQAARRVVDHNGVRWLGSSTSGLILSGGNSTGGMPDALRFTGYDCAEVVAPMAGANVVNANFLGNGTAIGALVEAEGSLLVVSEAGEIREVAAGFDEWWTSDFWGVWTLTGERLAFFPGPGEPTASIEGVLNVLVTAFGAAVRLEDGLYWANPLARNELLLLDPEGCRPRVSGTGLVFESPCDSGRVAVWLRTNINDEKTAEVVALQAEDVVVDQIFFDPRSVPPPIYFITNSSPEATTGDLWVAGADGEPTRIGTRANLEQRLLLVDWDGETGTLIAAPALVASEQGHLNVVARGNVLAPGVTGALGWGWLAFFDGTVGSLLLANGRLVLNDVPRHEDWIDAEGSLTVLADYDGRTASLYRLDSIDAEPRRLARHLVPGTLRELHEPKGYAYFVEPEPGRRELRSYVLRSELEQTVSRGATEFVATNTGLFYSAIEGADTGVWLARRR